MRDEPLLLLEVKDSNESTLNLWCLFYSLMLSWEILMETDVSDIIYLDLVMEARNPLILLVILPSSFYNLSILAIKVRYSSINSSIFLEDSLIFLIYLSYLFFSSFKVYYWLAILFFIYISYYFNFYYDRYFENPLVFDFILSKSYYSFQEFTLFSKTFPFSWWFLFFFSMFLYLTSTSLYLFSLYLLWFVAFFG